MNLLISEIIKKLIDNKAYLRIIGRTNSELMDPSAYNIKI